MSLSEVSSAPVDTTARINARAVLFVAMVFGSACALSATIWRIDSVPADGVLAAVLLLSVMALIGEAWQFVLPRSASASIAFIPYTALTLVVPTWVSLLAIALAKTAYACFIRRAPLKSIFNVSQNVVMFACTILAYRVLGGTSFLARDGGHALSFSEMTGRNGLPALVAFCVSFMVNMVLVSKVIAIHSQRSALEVWRENYLPGIALDLLAAPIVFVFAWVYVTWGPIAAAVMWVPILGYRHTIKTTLDLERTNRELLELMIKSIEARDPYTSGHSRRVQQYAIVIARSLNLSEREVEHVGTSALLHDVGKIHEKYGKILTKEEKLSPDEWALMQEHPIDGAELVATMTNLHRHVAPVRHHHENWDGTGYPDGLAGDRIPLASRIIMFADTIDAMTTARPYRGPLTEDVVRAEFVRRRGEQFDPAIADVILSSVVWRQLFVPSHRASRGHSIALADTGEMLVVGSRAARNFVKRASSTRSSDETRAKKG